MHTLALGARGRRLFVHFVFLLAAAAFLAAPALAQRQMENLGRGVVAVRTSTTEVFVSWRLLGYEPQDVPFNIYRSSDGGPAVRLNAVPLQGGTNFTDATANPAASNTYFVRPVIHGVELAASAGYTLPPDAPVRPYLAMPLRATPWPTYVHLVWVGDLDGDGEYDFVVSRLPLEAERPQFIDAYKRDGTFLWQVNFGPNSIGSDNIQSTASVICNGHNDGVTVYDLDSDGRAEVIVKSAHGVIFGDGQTLTHGDNVTQFISVLDGLTGAERARATVPTDYIADGPVGGHFGIAYLDGVNPSFVFKAKNRVGSGPFNLFVAAWDFDGSSLTQRWKWLRGNNDAPDNHQIRIVDVDRDGRDEICDGGYVLDDDGTMLYSLGPQGIVHGDRFHIGDLDPDRPGLEGFGIQQNNASGLLYFVYNAATGAMIHQHFGGIEDTARGTAADVSATYRGYEYWSFHGIHEIQGGTLISPDPRRPWPNFRIWWDGDVMSENLNREFVEKWDPATGGVNRLLTASADGAVDSWRDAAQFYGDILGDWREEVVYEKTDHTALLIYTSPIPSSTRIYTLPHNPEYRACFTVKGYLQSNMIDYYLGDGMTPPPAPDIIPVIGQGSDTPVIVAFTTDTGVADDDRITSDNTPTLHGLARPNASLVISRIGLGDEGTTTTDSSGAWSFTYPAAVADGQHYFLARVDDGLGNYSLPFAIRIDTTPPAPPTIEAVVSNGAGGYVVHGTAEPGLRVELTIAGVGVVGATVADVDGRWSFAYTGAALPAVGQTFLAAASDIAGNASDTAQREVDLAVAIPTILAVGEDTGVSASDRTTSDATLVLSGTADPGAQVSVHLLGLGLIGTAPVDAGGVWTFDYSGVVLGDGIHAFTAFSGPSAGAAAFEVTIDRAAPAITAIERIAPSAATSSSSTVTFRLVFTERIAGLDSSDLAPAFTGTLEGGISGISPAGPASHDVTISPLAGEGTVRLDLNASGTGITDLAGNPVAGGFTTGDVFTRVLLGDGVWTRTASGGLWSDNANWLGGVVAHGVGTTANFGTIEIPEDNLVRLDSPRTVTNLIFGDEDVTSVANWRIDANGDPGNVLTLVAGTAGPSVTVDALGGGARATIAAPLAGTNGFSKAGPGTLSLAGASMLSGTVTVGAGVVRIESGGILNPGTVNMSGFGNAFTVAGGEVTATGNANVNSGANLIIDGGVARFPAISASNNTGNAVRVNGGQLIAGSVSFQRSTDGSLNYNTGLVVRGGEASIGAINLGTSNSNGMMSVEGGLVTASGAITLGNQSSGGRGGHLRVTGGEFYSTDSSATGGLILTRRNNNVSTANFLGGVSVVERISLGFSSSVTSGSGTVNLDGGELYLGAGSMVKEGGGTFAANVNLRRGTLGAMADWSCALPITLPGGGTLAINAGDADGVPHDITLAGGLSGPGGFTKIGSGRLALSGESTFAGGISVEEGALEVDGIIGAGEPVAIDAGGLLSGDGVIARAIVLNTNGTVLPGAEEDGSVLTIDSLTWQTGGTLGFDLGAISNRLAIAGAMTRGGDGPHAVVFNAGPGIAAGKIYTLATFGSTDFGAADFSFGTLAPGLTGAFIVGANELFFKVYGPPIVLASPQDATVRFGGTAAFAVEVGESPSLAYQWFKDDQPIEGANQPALVIDNVQGYSIGRYHVVVTNAAGSTTTAAATLSIASLALVNRGPSLNSAEVTGSIQQMLGTNAFLNGNMVVTGSLFVPGTPAVVVNGSPTYGGTLEGGGGAAPSGYSVTVNSGTTLAHVVRRTDPVSLPVLAGVVAPAGTRSVTINNASQSAGDWSTVRNLTLNGGAGQVTVPAGAYGNFAVNTNGGFTLGVPGATTPSVYHFQQLTLNGGATVQVVGPVLLVVANSFSVNGGAMGSAARPEWLTLNAHGSLTLNSAARVHGYVAAPAGLVTINNTSEVTGGLAADRLTLNSHGVLELLGPPVE